MNTTFYRLLLCQIVTLFANAALRFALPLYLLRKTGSAALYGGITAAALVPMLVGTLYGGILADNCRKQTLLAVLNFITALGLLAAAICFRQIPSTAVVLGTLCLLYAAEGLFQPAVQASLPLLLLGPALTQGNAAIQLTDTIDELLGPLLGSLLLQSVGLRTLLIFCAVCLAATALFSKRCPSHSQHANRLQLPGSGLPLAHCCATIRSCSAWSVCWRCSTWPLFRQSRSAYPSSLFNIWR